MDEKAADGNHGDTDNGSQPRQLGHQDGGAQPGKEARDGAAAGNLMWISSAGEAQEAVRRILEEQAPIIGYCHECGWWHELPRFYSFETSAGPEDENTDDWQAELLHDVDEDTFEKLDNLAADIDEMATKERWLFCRSCKAWHTVPCSRTSSKFLMLSILELLLQTRPVNSTELQGKGNYSMAALHGVAVFEHRYDAALDASTSIIMIEIPFLRMREEMGKLRTAMEKASKEYDQEKELYAGLEEELSRFNITPSSTVELFTVQDEREAGRTAWALQHGESKTN
jgi:hypothetical protein